MQEATSPNCDEKEPLDDIYPKRILANNAEEDLVHQEINEADKK